MSETLLQLNDYPPEPYFCETLPLKFLKEQHVFPLTLDENRLSVAMADPTNMNTVDAIHLATGYEIIGHPSAPEDILQAITQLYDKHSAMGEIIGDMHFTTAQGAGVAVTPDTTVVQESMNCSPAPTISGNLLFSGPKQRCYATRP